MDDDKLRELRDALHKERDMTLADRIVRHADEEPYWLGPCLALLSEVERLRSEVVALQLRPPMGCMSETSFVRGRAPSPKYKPYLVAVQLSPQRTNADVERLLNSAKDWCRFGRHNWIIITSKSAKDWYERLQPVVDPGGELFISPVDLSKAAGLMSEDFWDWVAKWKSADSKTGG